MKRHTSIWSTVRIAALSLFALPWVGLPLWMVLVNSFKPAGAAASLDLSLPTDLSFIDNYGAVFTDGDYLRALGNSLLVSIPTIVVVILLGAASSWVFARGRAKWEQFAFYVIALSMLIPPTLIPTIFLLKQIGLSGSTLGYVLVLIGTRLGIVVFLTTSFIRSMPEDIEEAASLDGASRSQTFFRVVLPLTAPILIVGAIMLVINVWGDFFFAQFLLTGTSSQTLPLSLYTFANSSAQSLRWNLVFAHVALSGLPLIIAFVFLQKQVIGGLTDGALKG